MITGQFEILRPFITDRVQELVRGRLLEGMKFFDGHTLRSEFTRAEAKLALLLVRMANPTELLNEDEAALLKAGMRQMQTDARKEQSPASKRQKSARKPKHRKPSV